MTLLVYVVFKLSRNGGKAKWYVFIVLFFLLQNNKTNQEMNYKHSKMQNMIMLVNDCSVHPHLATQPLDHTKKNIRITLIFISKSSNLDTVFVIELNSSLEGDIVELV